MGWASGFRTGSQVGRDALDTYEKSKLQRELGRVRDATPEQVEGFTAEQGEQLRLAGESGQYDIGFDASGNYTVTPKVGGETGTIARGLNTDFLGQRHAGQLSADQIATQRGLGYADVVSAVDPIRGLELRRGIKQGQRDDRRFEREEQLAPLQLRAAQRTDRRDERVDAVIAAQDEVSKMSDEQIEEMAYKLNTNGSGFPMLFQGKGKGGYSFLEVDLNTGKTGREHKLNSGQLRALATAYQLGQRGFGAESMAVLQSANKDIGEYLSRWNQALSAATTSQNDAQYKGDRVGLERDRLDLDTRRAQAAASNDAARTRAAVGQASRPNWERVIDAQGNAVLVDSNRLPTEGGIARLPEGLRFPKTIDPERQRAVMAARQEWLTANPNATLDQQAQAMDRIDAMFGLDDRGVSGALPGLNPAASAARLQGGAQAKPPGGLPPRMNQPAPASAAPPLTGEAASISKAIVALKESQRNIARDLQTPGLNDAAKAHLSQIIVTQGQRIAELEDRARTKGFALPR